MRRQAWHGRMPLNCRAALPQCPPGRRPVGRTCRRRTAPSSCHPTALQAGRRTEDEMLLANAIGAVQSNAWARQQSTREQSRDRLGLIWIPTVQYLGTPHVSAGTYSWPPPLASDPRGRRRRSCPGATSAPPKKEVCHALFPDVHPPERQCVPKAIVCYRSIAGVPS